MACVCVCVQEGLGGDFTYFLHIGSGDNQITELYEGGTATALVTIQTASILSCDHLRSYWIDWESGTFKFGLGSTKGLSTILSYPIDTVASVGLATDHVNGALWQIYKNAGENSYIT